MYWIWIELVPIIFQYVPILPNITGAHLDWRFGGLCAWLLYFLMENPIGSHFTCTNNMRRKIPQFFIFFERFCRDFDYGSDNVLCQCDGLIRTLLRFLWPHSHNMMHRWCYKAFCLLENSKQMLDPTFFHWENFRGQKRRLDL